MSVSISELEKHGCSSADYKKLFTAKEKDRPKKLKELIDVLSSRRREGMENCLRDHRGFWAIDLAYEAPVSQTTTTLVQALLSQKLDAKDTLAAIESWGLKEGDLFLSVPMTLADGTKADQKILNPPVFWEILVPIVKAYVTIRCASLYNERDKSPLLPYTPLKQTDKNRVVCDVITDFVDTISNWYGYPSYLRQAILQMLKYGVMITFTKEEWDCEWQLNEDGKKEVQREGLRYDMPHPSRMFYDLYHPVWTLNTGTGCEFAGHWDAVRAGDILDNKKYWNRDSITWGDNWFSNPLAGKYFQEAFPCRMRHPTQSESNKTRLDKASCYTSNDRDTAMFLTRMFWRLVPNDWGLGTYKYPVWHRFVLASDDTIVWAEPCAYNPTWFMGYDFDDQAGTASSLATETVPWQGHVGNILSEMVRTAKKNLSDFFTYDNQLVDKKDIDALNLLGDRKYAGPQFIPMDSMKMARAGLDWKQPFSRIDVGYHSIVESQQCLSTALTIMERVLQITAQEAGTTANHYQSAKEVSIVQTSGNNRLRYTASGVDDGIDAWKRQLFDASQAYLDNEVTAQVSSDTPDLEKHLADLGFKVESKGARKMLVKGDKKSLRLEGFARSNLGPQESADPAMAQVIFQTLGVVAQNPEVFQTVGVNRIVKLLEQGAKLAGAPRDFDLTGGGQEKSGSVMAQIGPVLQQLQQSMMEAVQKNFGEPIAKEVAKTERDVAEIQQTLQKLESIFKVAEAQSQKTTIMAQEAQLQAQIDQAKFAADEQRKQQSHQAQMQRDSEKAGLKMQVDTAAAQVELKAKSDEAQLGLQVKAAEGAAKVQGIREQSSAKARVSKKSSKDS